MNQTLTRSFDESRVGLIWRSRLAEHQVTPASRHSFLPACPAPKLETRINSSQQQPRYDIKWKMTTEVTTLNKASVNIVTISPKTPPASFSFLSVLAFGHRVPQRPIVPVPDDLPPLSVVGRSRFYRLDSREQNGGPRSFGLRKWSKKFETGREKGEKPRLWK